MNLQIFVSSLGNHSITDTETGAVFSAENKPTSQLAAQIREALAAGRYTGGSYLIGNMGGNDIRSRADDAALIMLKQWGV